MQSSNLSLGTWGLAAFQLTTNLKGVSSLKLHRDLEVTYKTPWHLSQRIREAVKEDSMDFTGSVAVDESYFGGNLSNLPRSKRTWGRGTKGKAPVVGMVDRETKQISAASDVKPDTQDLRAFIIQRASLAPSSTRTVGPHIGGIR